jgi:NOL1/NOP2/fmu family ribosome biogenesis protein
LEDEGVVEWLVSEYGEELDASDRVAIDDSWGIVRRDIGPFQCFHFYPHRAQGEGFFAAIARKAEGPNHRASVKPRRKLFQTLPKADEVEVARWVDEPQRVAFRLVGDVIYGYDRAVVDDVVALSESLSVIYSGVCYGQIFKRKLKPEHPLALYVGFNGDVVPSVEVDLDTALAYLRRQDIAAAEFEEGINRVMYRGVAIGFVKRIGARCNNMYPKDLRILKL